MKLYRVNFASPHDGTVVSWYSNKDAAERALRVAQKERGQLPTGMEGVEAVEVPTTRDALLKWLNANLTSDNG